MILSQGDIRKCVDKGEIAFSPEIEDKQWGEASIDLRLGHSFTKLKKSEGFTISVSQGLSSIGSSGLWITKELKDKDEFGKAEKFIIEPGEFVLALTHEKITIPKNMIGLVEGRSTYARVGLSMHQTAPWIQPGWSGPIVLEIMNNGPWRIELTPLVDRPCQLTFLELKTELPEEKAYGSRATDHYKDQTHPLNHNSKSTPTG